MDDATTRPPFRIRFPELGIDEEEARRGFVVQVANLVWEDFFERVRRQMRTSPTRARLPGTWWGDSRYDAFIYPLKRAVAQKLSVRLHKAHSLESLVDGDFWRCLKALEAVYGVMSEGPLRDELEKLIRDCLKQSETDIGIRWNDGAFWPAGSPLLDEPLVNKNLLWLSRSGHRNVYEPFAKALKEMLEGHQKPERYPDVITDAYEALEAMAQNVLRNNKELSANREPFVKALKGLTKQYKDRLKKILKEYIDYGCDFRHAKEKGKPLPRPPQHEVESFVYLTGLLIRLGIECEKALGETVESTADGTGNNV